MGDKGKKDKGKREDRKKKSKHTLKEKRRQKNGKTTPLGINEK